MSTSKHVRRTGATTIKRDGKIVSNIGRGKINTPTSHSNFTQKLDTTETDVLSTSTLADAQQKFDNLSRNIISFEHAQVLWNLTTEKNLAERLNVLGNYIDNMSDVGKTKLFRFIEDEMSISGAYRTSSTGSRNRVVQVLEGVDRGLEEISPNVLDAFARYTCDEWKRAVARNKNTAAETLDFLADSDGTWLLINVAKHPRTASQTIAKIFAKTKYEDVLDAISYNQNTSQKILTKLSKSEIRIRRNVARHANTSVETLSYLSKDVEYIVRYAVAENWNTPPEILDILSQDSDIDIVWCVADNCNTPYSTLKRLAKNPNEGIEYAAKANPKYAKRLLLNSKVERI